MCLILKILDLSLLTNRIVEQFDDDEEEIVQVDPEVDEEGEEDDEEEEERKITASLWNQNGTKLYSMNYNMS